jgi:hypothetical protein
MAALKSGDCAGNVWLQWGDAVEIPEADHVIAERWPGLSEETMATLKECLTRQVEVVVKGKATRLTLAPYVTIESDRLVALRPKAPFMLVPVLYGYKLLLASSDLSRVRVKRHDPASGQVREEKGSNPNFTHFLVDHAGSRRAGWGQDAALTASGICRGDLPRAEPWGSSGGHLPG